MFSKSAYKKLTQTVVSLMLFALTIAVGSYPTQAQRSPRRTVPLSPTNPVLSEAPYRLGGGDRIRIDNVKLPEYSGEYSIPVGGLLSLPLVGSLSLQGLTIEEAARAITAAYNRILKRPQIGVRLLEPRPINIAVSGEINRPGSYTISVLDTRTPGIRYPTVTQVIQQAEGVTQTADLSRVQVRRSQRLGSQQIINLNLQNFLRTGDRAQDISLRDGDTIFIPTATNISLARSNTVATSILATDLTKPRTVRVLGEITNPGSYVLVGGNTIPDRNIGGRPTVTRAIQLAGGITAASDLSQIQVRRATKAGTQQIFNVNLWRFFQAGDGDQDLIVQDGDTIFIPTVTTLTVTQANQLATVSLATEITKPRTVMVVGEISNPGSYVVIGGETRSEGRNIGGLPTVMRAIQLAGGTTAAADLGNVQVRRVTKTGVRQNFNLNLGQLLQVGDAEADLILQEGDTILVPTVTNVSLAQANQSATSSLAANITQPRTVTVVGEVASPGSYVVIGGETRTDGRNIGGLPTVTRAIQLAGGLTATADLRNIQVRRVTKTGVVQNFNIDLWQFLQAGNTDRDLIVQEGDSIFVPTRSSFNSAEVRQLSSVSFGTDPTKPRTVAVAGEVNRPGPYAVIGGETRTEGRSVGGLPTVTRAIQLAGGITQAADIRNIQVRRPTKAGVAQIINVNLWQFIQTGDFSQDLIVEQGDSIFIPTATDIDPEEVSQLAGAFISPNTIQVSVVGEVVRPGRIEVRPDTTLNQALLTAGGFNRSRSRRSTVELIRLNSNGTISRRTVPIDFNQGINEQTNPLLRSNDIIVVGRSGLARVGDTLDNLVGTGGVFSIFRIFEILGAF